MRTAILIALIAGLVQGCSVTTQIETSPKNTATFKTAEKEKNADAEFLPREALAALHADTGDVYHLGPGDKITIVVWGRQELSGTHTIGPDGVITLPIIGNLQVATLSRDMAAATVRDLYRKYYTKPVVDLTVNEYLGNRITVLGRVEKQGVLQFEKPPYLLEAIARAGGLPVLDKSATLTRVAIFRGRDMIIWIDLKNLLNRADLAYNIPLKANDLIYIPDSSDTTVYVLGSVRNPGAVRLTADMTVLDALAQAGGPTEDANEKEIAIYRPGKDAAQRFTLSNLLESDRKVNFALEEGDVLYIEKKGIADFGYVLRQLSPALTFMTFGMNIATPK
jgi:polysaccharide export outer membrane protein